MAAHGECGSVIKAGLLIAAALLLVCALVALKRAMGPMVSCSGHNYVLDDGGWYGYEQR
jgi:hypothetical protein